MGERLHVHVFSVAVGLLALSISGCQGRPKPNPTPVTPRPVASMPVPTPGPTPSKPESRRETIFFIKKDASLSPGALKKLKAWTASWGKDGVWVLACPANPGITPSLREKRFMVMRSELQKSGVSKIETKLIPPEPAGKYEPIYIIRTSTSGDGAPPR